MNKQHHLTRHHRKPKSVGGRDNSENISVILNHYHEAWHTLFGNKHPCQIAEEINQVFLDPQYRFQVVEPNKPTIVKGKKYGDN